MNFRGIVGERERYDDVFSVSMGVDRDAVGEIRRISGADDSV